jgi:hypothetical protein
MVFEASPPEARILPQAEAQIRLLSFDDRREAWLRIFGILFDPAADGIHKIDLPFPWACQQMRDDRFRIWYRLRADGGITILRVYKVGEIGDPGDLRQLP